MKANFQCECIWTGKSFNQNHSGVILKVEIKIYTKNFDLYFYELIFNRLKNFKIAN